MKRDVRGRIAALICLYGWNAVQDRLIARQARLPAQRPRRLSDRLLIPHTAGIVAGAVFTIQVFAQYLFDPGHFEYFPIARCTDYIQSNHLLAADTPFFVEDAPLGSDRYRAFTSVLPTIRLSD